MEPLPGGSVPSGNGRTPLWTRSNQSAGPRVIILYMV